jgi:hypothetical protein
VSVSDGQVASQDTVLVTVDNVNLVPVAEAGSDKTVQAGSTVTLNGSQSSDPDGDAISYIWSQVSGTSVSLNAPNTATPTFVASKAGTYVFSLKVYDGKDTSPADTVTVTVTSTTVYISLLTPSMGAVVSTNPTLSWSGKGVAKYRVLATVDKVKYTTIYTGTSTSCQANSSLWSWFVASGTTVYWYVEGLNATGTTVCKSSLGYFKKR